MTTTTSPTAGEPRVSLAEMTWPEAREALAAARVAIVPAGSTEQHGPGMTLSTDITMATAMSVRVARRLYPRAVVAPSLPFGLSPHHMRFPGTITLQPETFTAVLLDVLRSLNQHGVTRFLLLNGHGGNQAILSVVATRARHELGVEVATAMYSLAASDVLNERFGRAYMHACEVEASLALAAAPELVRKEALAVGEELPARYRYTALAGGGAPGGSFVDVAARMDEISANGALGDPRKASAEAGAAVLEVAERRLAEFLEDFMNSQGEETPPPRVPAQVPAQVPAR
ncbi:MAG TPA: creatininase family protein [Chloroflexota bacterium]|nr:creatininase family protein [Chloroflexota bacterium]